MYQKQGSIAETKAVEALTSAGFSIVSTNWKVRSAEIDIVAVRKNREKWYKPIVAVDLYFFEVKYREDASQGSGFAYITSTKLKQMRYAAELFASVTVYNYSSLHLGAIEVSGSQFETIEILTNISELLDS